MLIGFLINTLIKCLMLLYRRATERACGRHMWDDQRRSEQLDLRPFVFVADF